jgi:hypothetical protein
MISSSTILLVPLSHDWILRLFFSLPKTEKSPDGIILNFVGGVEENSWGCCFARFFPWDLEREETGGGTGWQSGQMPETLTPSTVWMKHDAK